MQFKIPLHVSVSLGTPTPSEETESGYTLEPDESIFGGFESTTEASQSAIDSGTFSLGALASSTFTWKSALSFALASKLSYENEDSVKRTARSWGFAKCEFIDVDDTQCFIASTSDVLLVAFRGTESWGDWLRNVNVPGRTRDYGVVHRGFLAAFQVVESKLRSASTGHTGKKLVLTGHSLGGALATVMAAEWQGFMPATRVATYGQPAVGRGAFGVFFQQHYSGRFFRFVNDDDIVPRVPPGYEHVGRLLHFDARGNLKNGESIPKNEIATESVSKSNGGRSRESFEQGPAMFTESQYQRLQAEMGRQVIQVNRQLSESAAAPIQEGIFPSVKDHSLDKYIAKIVAKV